MEQIDYEVGDTIVAIEDSLRDSIKKGDEFIAFAIDSPCCTLCVDIGRKIEWFMGAGQCKSCKKYIHIDGDVKWYLATKFKKKGTLIELSTMTVEDLIGEPEYA